MGDENVNFINILLKDSEGRKDQKKMFYDLLVWKNGRNDLLSRLAYETSSLYQNATVQNVYEIMTVVCVLFLIRLRHGFRQINFPRRLLFWVKIRILHCTLHNLFYILSLWVCTRDSTFLHSTFNFDSCNIQVFAFDIQLFISSSQVFEFNLQVQWNVHSLFRI